MESIRKPSSSYFWYIKKNRSAIKRDHPDLALGPLQKVISEHWNALPTAEREVYSKLASDDRERYDREVSEYRASHPGEECGPTVDGGSSPQPSSASGATILPLARVKRILKVDRDLAKISKGGADALLLAAESFVRHLADDTQRVTHLSGRKTASLVDLQKAVRQYAPYAFLESDIEHFLKHPLRRESKPAEAEAESSVVVSAASIAAEAEVEAEAVVPEEEEEEEETAVTDSEKEDARETAEASIEEEEDAGDDSEAIQDSDSETLTD